MAKNKSGGVTFFKKGGEKISLAELNSVANEAHINIKEKKKNNNKNKEEDASKKGRPASHGLSGTRVYRAWYNAKQRCTNPKLKQYKDYGGRGIKFRLPSPQDLVDAIGHPKEKQSLDRKDFNGNYEPNNIRWADAKTQAENRRSSKFYKKLAGDRIRLSATEWIRNAEYWNASVACANTPHLKYEVEKTLKSLEEERGLPRFSWEWGTPKDKAFPLHDCFDFPSLTSPNEEVSFSCYPFYRVEHEQAAKRGIVGGLFYLPIGENATKYEIRAFKAYEERRKRKEVSGLCLTGSFYQAVKSQQPPERFLMALAAALLQQPKDVRFAPMVSIANGLKYEKQSDNYESDILWVDYLIIPDFSIAAANGFGMPPWMAREFYQWLVHRAEGNYQTIIFAHDLHFFDKHEIGVSEVIRSFFHVVEAP